MISQPIQENGSLYSNKLYALIDQDTKKKIRKHLSDKDDVITEDDIKNIRTDIFMLKSESRNLKMSF